MGSFKTPTLRNVELTAPYMHDGRFESLEDVIDHYDTLDERPSIGHMEESLKPLNLSEARKKKLIAFLKSLTSEITDLSE
jgi:cytochrome c peroxidase